MYLQLTITFYWSLTIHYGAAQISQNMHPPRCLVHIGYKTITAICFRDFLGAVGIPLQNFRTPT